MSLVLKSNPQTLHWQPSASLANLRTRAEILQKVRQFFAAKQVLEVETPLLCHTSVTDPFIESIPASVKTGKEQTYYLQTSPEYAMKRLLAAGSGCIYQITKAFRQGEIGRYHNPEFLMLEWYRLNFTHHDLMDEMDELLQCLFGTQQAERISYGDLFTLHLNINPYEAELKQLEQLANKLAIKVQAPITDVDTWLNLFMSHLIEPQLGKDNPCFIYDFPVSQAALARLNPGEPKTAARFEVYFKGVELANGFHELQDEVMQRNRFEANLVTRKLQGLTPMVIDERLLAALNHGLPDCAGVALGLDRLLMLITGSNMIADVLSFDFTRV